MHRADRMFQIVNLLRDIGLTRADVESQDEHHLADIGTDKLQRRWPQKSNF